ncbi:hypothetical protein HG536_0A05320 [Torulaspora globosa]|uniref:Ribosomal RNA-processing protein 17 n=1 Tax=Torulaspora globosa TaxID=48254 RepID=A0A7G3ZB31_9SACH|nr:uncharacterized protein HG536_0A05320 [Torulaspora globosa]QLL30717.1 hypothetical protein HG536_0A05320 [Torulaspora globosa]
MCAARSNRQILSQGKNYADKKLKKFGTDEVSFDKDSRLEYLTGFHKRKLQRQKKAKEFIKEQERLNKIEERKNIRDERKRQLDERLRNFKQGLELGSEGDDSDDAEGKEEEEAEEWNGFESDCEEAAVKPILKTVYSDNSSVSVETLEANDNFAYLAKINNVDLNESDKVLKQSIVRAGKYAKFLGMADKDTEKTKQKKKKFRYLTKSERKRNQYKANSNKRRR